MNAQEIQEVDTRFREARKEGDCEQLESLLAAPFILVRNDGKVLDREGYLKQVRESKLRQKEPLEDLEFHVVGETGVVAGVHQVSGDSFTSGAFAASVAVTRTWVRQDGRLRLALFHYHHLKLA